jgi:hypothetical protein
MAHEKVEFDDFCDRGAVRRLEVYVLLQQYVMLLQGCIQPTPHMQNAQSNARYANKPPLNLSKVIVAIVINTT